MTKEKLIQKISVELGVSKAESDLAYEVFIDKLISTLNYGETIKVADIGYFQLKRKIKNTDGTRVGETLIYAPNESELLNSDNLFLTIDVTDKRKNKLDFDDSLFSLSIGKPIIPITEAAKDKYDLESSFIVVKKAVEDRAEEILSKADVLKNFDIIEDYISTKKSTDLELEEIEEAQVQEDIGILEESEIDSNKDLEFESDFGDDERPEIDIDEELTAESEIFEEELLSGDDVKLDIEENDEVVDNINAEPDFAEEPEVKEDLTEDFEESIDETFNHVEENIQNEINQDELELAEENIGEKIELDDVNPTEEIFDEVEEPNLETVETEAEENVLPDDASLDADLEAIKAMAGDSYTDELDDLDDDLSDLKDFFDEDEKIEETLSTETEEEIPVEEKPEIEDVKEKGILEEEEEDIDIESVLDETISDVIDNSEEKKEIREDGIIPDEFDMGVKEKDDDEDEWDWGDELKNEIESEDLEEEEDLKDEEDVDDLFEHLGDSVDETLGEGLEEETENVPEEESVEVDKPEENIEEEPEVEEEKEEPKKEKQKKKISFDIKKFIPALPFKLGKLFWIIFSSFLVVTIGGIYFLLFYGAHEKEVPSVPLVDPDYSVKLVEPEMNIYGEAPKVVDKHKENKSESVQEKKSEHKNVAKKDEHKSTEDKKHNSKTAVKKTETKHKKISKKPIKYLEEKDLKKVGKFIFTDGKFYSVQIASFKSKKITEREVKKLRAKGYDAFVVKAYLKFLGGTWYRINVGGFKTKAQAEKFQKSYK